MGFEATADQRALKRHPVQLLVFDRQTGRPLGSTIDLHTMGMLVVGSSPIPLDTDIPVLLEYSLENGEKKSLGLIARGVWTMQNVIPEIHNTGCCFIDTEQAQISELEEILTQVH